MARAGVAFAAESRRLAVSFALLRGRELAARGRSPAGRRWLLVQARRRGPGVALLVVATLPLWLAVALLSQTAVAGAAALLAAVASWEPARQAVQLAPGDDLHASLALQMLGDIRVLHLALSVPGSDLLSSEIPMVAALDGSGQGAWASVVFSGDSSSVGVHAARVLAHSGLVVLGMLVASAACRGRSAHGFWRWPRPALAGFIAGLLAETYGATKLLTMDWSPGSGGDVMLSMAATKILGMDGETYDAWAGAAPGLLSLALNLCVLAVVLLTALQLRRPLKLARPYESQWPPRLAFLLVLPHHLPGPLALAVVVLLLQTPLKAMATFDSAGAESAETGPAMVELLPGPAGDQPAEVAPVAQVMPAPQPSVVRIETGPEGYTYWVNGKRRTIRGIGYNAMTLDLSEGQRRERLARDFRAIRSAGANTIVGWSQAEFDEVLLDEAAKARVGVILPFELDPKLNHADPRVRARVKADIAAWMERHRDSPALRMWGLGNEVIHSIGNPRSAKALSCAWFLLEAADYMHSLDPDHPVIYRDAEDSYLEPLALALGKGGPARPWFVYGMNFFSYRMANALKDGPATKVGLPLLISEFGPAGMWRAQRHEGYLKQWGIIRTHGRQVLGGSAYVWTTQGPEALDRSFGLTDDSGAPVDNSLNALASVFRGEELTEAAQAATVAESGAQPRPAARAIEE